mmetsp:Transcript_42991/g.121548  ORF Transcript_42991/g.121548 Transcript_42991/m.121548 type:complete len:301 (-) Transcript_42991:1411-2313(-)
MWLDVLPPTSCKDKRCMFIPPPSSPCTSGFRLTRNLKSSSSSESPFGSSTVIFTSDEFVALPATSKKLFIVSGRHANSITKLAVSASVISCNSNHMTPAASTSPKLSNLRGSPHMYSPVHFVASFTFAARQASEYFLMLAIGSKPWSQRLPSTVCRPLAASTDIALQASLKWARESGEKIESCTAGQVWATRTTSFVQRNKKAWCMTPLWQSCAKVGPCVKLGLGARRAGRSVSTTGCSNGRKRSSIFFLSNFLPMKTILQTRCSCSPQSGPSDVSVTSATAWKTNLAERPAAARTPLER